MAIAGHILVVSLVFMTLAKVVSKNIRLVRTQQSLSQPELAKKARLSVSYISMLERGVRVPPLDTLEVVAKALGVAPLYLCQELSTDRPRRAVR